MGQRGENNVWSNGRRKLFTERQSTDDENRWEWLKRGERKCETESLLCSRTGSAS